MVPVFRTLLYVPAHQPRMLEKSRDLDCDAIIFDLEDAVPQDQKVAARQNLQTFLKQAFEKPYLIRINALGTEAFDADLTAASALHPLAIVLPKAHSKAVFTTGTALDRLGNKTTGLLPMVESPLAVETMLPLLDASPRVLGAQIGAEDLTAELGVPRTSSGEEISYARHRVVYGCRARGLPAYDTPYLDFQDSDGLAQDARTARSIGFAGKVCIHPQQIEIINQAFAPTDAELNEARLLLAAAEKSAGGAFSYQGRMIDGPVLDRARQLLDRI